MDDQTRLLLTDPPLPLLTRMATPNSIAFLVQSGVSMTEVWFVGQLGSTPLAAIALVFPLLMLTQTLSGGAMGGAVASAIARALGAGNVERAEQLIWHALALACTGAALLLIAFLLFGESFLIFLGGSDESLAEALEYGYLLAAAGVFVWLMGTTSAIYRGMGNMRFPALLMMAGAFIQVPTSAGLIMGLGGLPSLGITGAAISVTLSSLILSCIMLARLALGKTTVRLHFQSLVFSRDLFRDILKVTLPASLSPILTVTTIITLTAIVGSFGESALAGYGIGSRIEFLLIPLVFGLGAAMTSLVGMSIGAKDPDRAEQVGRTGGLGAAGIAGSVGITLALTADYWIPVFTSDALTQKAATQYIQIVGPCFAFNGLGLALYFASQGASAMFWPITATVVRITIALGGAWLLTRVFGYGLESVFVAAGAGMVVYGAMIAISIRLGAWRQ